MRPNEELDLCEND